MIFGIRLLPVLLMLIPVLHKLNKHADYDLEVTGQGGLTNRYITYFILFPSQNQNVKRLQFVR